MMRGKCHKCYKMHINLAHLGLDTPLAVSWEHMQLSAWAPSPDTVEAQAGREAGQLQGPLGSFTHNGWKLVAHVLFFWPLVMLTQKCIVHCIPESSVAVSLSCPYLIIDLMTFPFPLLVSFISLIHFPSSQQRLWDYLPSKPLVLIYLS